jgi:hypothetical protein
MVCALCERCVSFSLQGPTARMWRVLVVRSVATLLPLVACLNLRRERRHPTLERAKHDLLYRCTIRRRAAKQGTTIRVPTLSGDEARAPIMHTCIWNYCTRHWI